MSNATFSVARAGGVVFVRASGLANMKHAPTLDAFFDSVLNDGIKRICIDLYACAGMDSTFMGLLVGTARRMEDIKGRLVVVNPGDKNLALLTMLGVTEVVTVLAECAKPDASFVDLTSSPQLNTRQRMQLVKTAHEHLARLSDTNQQKFAPFLSALDKDLTRLTPLPEVPAAKPAVTAMPAVVVTLAKPPETPPAAVVADDPVRVVAPPIDATPEAPTAAPSEPAAPATSGENTPAAS